MKKDSGTSSCVTVCLAATMKSMVVVLAVLAPGQALAGETARPVASMTVQERQNLPDHTLVKLKSGRTASLGVLRAEHQARMQRFARASAMGQMAAGKLSDPSGGATQPNQVETEKRQSPVRSSAQKEAQPSAATANRTGSANHPGVGTKVGQAGTGLAHLPFFVVPLQIVSAPLTPIPKDYMDFCTAAKATACIYIPANTSLTAYQGDPNAPNTHAMDEDLLITDPDVCKYDGGLLWGAECLFYYPLVHIVNFKPTGSVSTSAACDPPSKYLLDQKGAVKASYLNPNSTFTLDAPITCAVQVWISR